MKYTEEEILKIAGKVLIDLGYSINPSDIEAHFEKDISEWLVTMPWASTVLSDTGSNEGLAILGILDETGEPLYFQTSMSSVREIEKGEDGKYQFKKKQGKTMTPEEEHEFMDFLKKEFGE